MLLEARPHEVQCDDGVLPDVLGVVGVRGEAAHLRAATRVPQRDMTDLRSRTGEGHVIGPDLHAGLSGVLTLVCYIRALALMIRFEFKVQRSEKCGAQVCGNGGSAWKRFAHATERCFPWLQMKHTDTDRFPESSTCNETVK